MGQLENMTALNRAFIAGRDCGLRGANETNCHYRHFATPELTAEWERGKIEGERLLALPKRTRA